MADKPKTLGLEPSFGFGDRIGNATPGHVESMKRAGQSIRAIYPQQSIREMTRTNRTPSDVMNDACNGAEEAGWTEIFGADADHLKTEQDVDVTAEVGFTFFTIDPSDGVDSEADNYDAATVASKFAPIAGQIDWIDAYRGKTIKLSTGRSIEFDEVVCQRAAVKYGAAINRAVELANYIKSVHTKLDRDYEIELSVDETEQPTTLAEHYIIADQCLQSGMKLVSLAPRFVGDFEKGVDFKGDHALLEQSLVDHSAIAEMLGPYKLSLHSGSDKISMYTAFAKATKGRFHVKTAGTSYLEAVRVAALHNEDLFRRIVDFSRDRFETDKATYHISATLDSVAPASEITDLKELERQYLELWPEVPVGKGFTFPGRQILHCTFGSVLTHPELGKELHQTLNENLGTYTEVLADHFARHLEALNAGV